MRGKTPQELAFLARERPTRKTGIERLRGPAVPTPVVARGEGRGRRGAPPRGGAGNTPRNEPAEGARAPHAARTGLATGVWVLRESACEQGRCLTATRTVRSTGRVGGSWVLGPTVGARTWQREPGTELTSANEARVRPDHVRLRARRTHGCLGASSRGDKAQESTDRTAEPWPGSGRHENGLSRGAKLRSGRVGRRIRRARPIRDETP
jgi:hypothetical protein